MPAKKPASSTTVARDDRPALDYSEIPDLGDDDAFWAQPPARRAPKQAVSLRVDPDVLDWFKAQGDGYQTRMNWALRVFMTAAERQAARGSRKSTRRISKGRA